MSSLRSSISYANIDYQIMTTGTGNWSKFRLLLWKNFLLQWRHKIQFFVEIFIPVLFCTLLVIIRSLVDSTEYPKPITFQPVEIQTLNTLRMLSFNTTGPKVKSWTLIYTPKNDIFDHLVRESAQSLELTGILGVDNEQLLQIEMIKRQALAGIVFEHNQTITSLPTNLRYSLRFPSELRTMIDYNSMIFNWQTNLLFPRFQLPGPRNQYEDNGGLPPGYQQEGFLAVQNAIAQTFLKMSTNKNMPKIMIQRYPYPAYVSDVLLTGLETLFSLLILLTFINPALNTVKFIAREKEKQLKEVMKIMGLPNWLHWTGWFVRTMILLTISVSIIILLFKISSFNEHGIAILPHSDWTALWFFLFVYCIVTTMFTFMMSVFFSQANIAAAVGGLVWFLSYTGYSFTMESYDYLTLTEKLSLCLLSNTGMAYGMQNILRLESRGEGLQWNNMWQPMSIDDKLAIGHIIIMFFVGAFLYLLIALYVEKIYPGEYGVPERWYFPFTKEFWCHNLNISDDIQFTENIEEYFETEPQGKHAGIRIKKLSKMYANKKVAVESLTMNMYDDQITVLLGHNGAGKTTTMSMLCGMFPPTSGTAFINGKNIRTDIQGVRNSLGLCPQHNILFDELTVREHLIFYGRLKGLDSVAIEEEVNKYIKLIDLEDKRNAMASTLSGGMKRKLSVCVAFCGGSKVVLCDEPTSGMDPAARRALWDVLKMEKHGRTVLLSTHFMDEADILGDRIAIMAEGQLKCVGSPYFLKKKIGTGYHLICVKKDGCDTGKITTLLRKYIPGLPIENNIGTELSYSLPDAESSKFQPMFKELEDKADELRVESYGVSLSTMEDVFLKVGSDKQNPVNAIGSEKSEINGNDYEANATNFIADIPLLGGFTLVKNQIHAMFMKKFYQTIRSYKLLFLQLIMPLVYLIITVESARQRAMRLQLSPLPITLNSYDRTFTVLETDNAIDADSLTAKISKYYQQNFDEHEKFLETISGSFSDHILELSKTKLVRINSQYLIGATVSNETTLIAWFNNQGYHTAPLSVNLLHNAVIQAYLGNGHGINLINSPLPFSEESRLQQLQSGGSMGFQLAINLSFALAFVGAFYILPYIKERESRFKLVQFVSGVNVLTYWLTAFLWDLLTMVITMVLLILTLAAYQENGWSTGYELSNVFFVLFAFGFGILPLTYIASMFFTVPATGFTRMTLFYIFTGIALFFTVFVMSFPMYNLKNTADILTSIFMIFPHFALSHSLNNFNTMTTMMQICDSRMNLGFNCTNDLFRFLTPNCCDLSYVKWEEPGFARDIVYLFVTGIVCFILLLLIEFKIISSLRYFIRSFWETKISNDNGDVGIDADVKEEQERVQAMSTFEINTHNLVLKNMSKFYGEKMAVKQMSVAVENTECFGLLGINGAGKTSTFKMLTGDIKITSGEAWIRGISLKSNMKEVYKYIGYCPQFDALIGELTARETIHIFGLLRGIPKIKLQSITEILAMELNFMQHIDKKTKNLSGGNRRKVSTAIAILGNPAVIYLDEPTTGMDPVAKRHLWNIICKVRESGKSIVLTSHSMDECEALCTRLAIMVNGEFKCLGSVQHLKNRFSKGFTLVIKRKKDYALQQNGNVEQKSADYFGEFIKNVRVKSTRHEIENSIRQNILSTQPINEFILKNFPGSILQEEFQGLSTYYIPINTTTKWSTMFGLMEEAKPKYDIEDYSLSQTSLEQIFLSFTKYQTEDLRLGR